MTVSSMLFRDADTCDRVQGVSAPAFFADLNLEQIVAAVTAGKEEYELKPFFYQSLTDADEIAYRQEVMQELDRPRLYAAIKSFADSMRHVGKDLLQAEKLHYKLQQQRWFLDAADTYCEAVTRLANDLASTEPAARALVGFRDYLEQYLASERFTTLSQMTRRLIARLSEIHYRVVIKGAQIEVQHYEDELNYGAELTAAFERFRQGTAKQYAFTFADSAEMNHVEAAILDLVARLHPETFSELESYVKQHRDFVDPPIIVFDREIQFYVAFLEYIRPFSNAGLSFCYPRIVRDTKEIYDYQGFDLALAGKLIGEKAIPVCNDFHLRDGERIVVVTGPNQGGKTTFARTFGQLHYLACLGCPVPGTRAQLFLFDNLFTHFEREENLANRRGKLQDDLLRIHEILQAATSDSLLIMNEIFTSTTFRDANALSRRIAQQIFELDLLCIWVTFLDELTSIGRQTVSMVSTVNPENPAQRSYKIVRQPADGLAYALSVAEEYGLTGARIRERLRS